MSSHVLMSRLVCNLGMSGHVQACLGMSRHVHPAPGMSRHAYTPCPGMYTPCALTFWGKNRAILGEKSRYACTCISRHGHPWTRVDTRGHAWTRLDTRGHAWIRVDTRGHAWRRMSMHVWPCTGMSSVFFMCIKFLGEKAIVL